MTGNTFTTWRKATYSVGNGNCVEVAAGCQAVGVRDTAQQGRDPILEFSVEAWRTFTGTTKSQPA